MTRVLLVGWSSVVHGEATAGDVLSMRAVEGALRAAGVAVDLAWSPVMATAPGAGGLELGSADPGGYTHLVWACGPLHGRAVEEVAARFAGCRRVAVGVSVVDDVDPALAAWDLVLPRDAPGAAPVRDLAAGPAAALAAELDLGGDRSPSAPGGGPVLGVCLAPGQAEYAARRRHDAVGEHLGEWLSSLSSLSSPWSPWSLSGGRRVGARLALDTRLDPRGWRDPHTPAEVLVAMGRCEVVVTSRLHGLVLALSAGVPVLALDPVAGGGKVSAQGAAWGWPVVPAADLLDGTGGGAALRQALDGGLSWCLGPQGLAAAARAAAQAPRAGSGQLEALVSAVLAPATPI